MNQQQVIVAAKTVEGWRVPKRDPAGGTGRRGRVVLLVALAIGFLTGGPFAGGARAGSIFDDDWTPPKKSEPTEPTPTTTPPHVSPPQRPNPGTPGTPVTPVGPASPAVAGAPRLPAGVGARLPSVPSTPAAPLPAAVPAVPQVRRPVPPKLEQAKSRGLLKQVYAEPLKDRSLTGLRRLAQLLMGEVPKYADNPTDQFVLLGGALEAAQDGASLKLCFQVADLTAKSYDVDALLVKAEAACKTLPKPGAVSTENIKEALELEEQLADAEEFAAASRVAAALQPVAAADSVLAKQAQQRRQEVEVARLAHERVTQQLEKLKTAPNDPAANTTAGEYFCFNKAQWDRGLPMLAKGSDAHLKALAASELTEPSDPDQVAALGDGWWEVAAKQPAANKTRVLQHTAKLYRKAMGGTGVTGLRRKLIQQRLADLPTEENRRVDLLALIDPAKNAVAGSFQLVNGALVSTSPWKGRIEFPYVPPEEYDFRIVFTYKVLPVNTDRGDVGHDGTRQVCYAGGRQFAWVLAGVDNRLSWFDQVNGMGWVPGNPTLKQAANTGSPITGALAGGGVAGGADAPAAGGVAGGWLTDGKRHTCVVKIRRNGAEAWLDDKLVSSLQTDFSNLLLWDGDRLRRPNTLGLGVWKDSVVLESADVLEVSGPGTALAPDANLAPDPEDGPTARGRDAIVLGTGAWSVEGQELAQTALDGRAAVLFGNPCWSRYNFTFKAKAVDGREGFRFQIHSTDLSNFTEVEAGAADNTRHDLIKVHDNRGSRGSKPVQPGGSLGPIEKDRWYDVRVEVRGSQCTCYLDGAKFISFSDPAASQGRIGFASGNTAVRFRDIQVTTEDGNTVLWKGPPRLPAKR